MNWLWKGMTVARDGEMIKVYECSGCGGRTTYIDSARCSCNSSLKHHTHSTSRDDIKIDSEIKQHHRDEHEVGIL